MISSLANTPGFRAVYGGAQTAEVTALKDQAEEFFRLHGMSAMEPRADESDMTYTRRALASALQFSPEFKSRGVNAFQLDESVLPIMWKRVVQDAVAAFKEPVGPLRQVISTDDSGRRMRQFYGSPEETWGPFKGKTQVITAWNPDGLGRGAKSHTAVVPVSMLMSDGSIREAR